MSASSVISPGSRPRLGYRWGSDALRGSASLRLCTHFSQHISSRDTLGEESNLCCLVRKHLWALWQSHTHSCAVPLRGPQGTESKAIGSAQTHPMSATKTDHRLGSMPLWPGTGTQTSAVTKSFINHLLLFVTVSFSCAAAAVDFLTLVSHAEESQ